MVKNTFMYLLVIILIGTAGWFFINKARNASKVSDINSIAKTSDSAPKPTPSTMEDAKSQGWVKLPNGLQIQDVVVGYGKEAKEGDAVSANYIGTLEDGTKFDSSYDRGEPFSFVLGGGMVIKGWDIGVVGMKVGGKRKLIIPPELGYGSRGAGGIIGPNVTLYFDIELMATQTPTK